MTFVMLLVTPIAAAAASGLPATISMDPASAGPGETIVVAGTDFPPEETVQLQLVTPEGLRYLDTVAAEEAGSFSRSVTLPADLNPGAWELQATTAGAISASHAFAAVVDGASAPAADAVTSSGNSAGDIAVMLVISVVLAAVVGGIGYVYFQLKLAPMQPGMAMGDDPIWIGGDEPDDRGEVGEQPSWLTPQADTMPASADNQG